MRTPRLSATIVFVAGLVPIAALAEVQAQSASAAAPVSPEANPAEVSFDQPLPFPSEIVPPRPRFEVAIGMGVSFDNAGLFDGRTVAVPSFQVQGAASGGSLGFEFRVFSSAADGRYHEMSKVSGANDMPVDRLALDLMLAWRPLFPKYADDSSFAHRILRSATVTLGLGVENVSQSQKSLTRPGAVVGFHVDVPLTPATDTSTLCFRLIGRKMATSRGTVGTTQVGESRGEAFAALAFDF